MTDQGPFANWPNLDRPKAAPERPNSAPERPLPLPPEHEYLILPGSTETELQTMASNNNAIENFLGGSPLAVAIRLLFISMIVGALLMWMDIQPMDILRGIRAFFNRIYELGFDAIGKLAGYVVAGAAIVVPAWFVLRVLNMGGGGKR